MNLALLPSPPKTPITAHDIEQMKAAIKDLEDSVAANEKIKFQARYTDDFDAIFDSSFSRGANIVVFHTDAGRSCMELSELAIGVFLGTVMIVLSLQSNALVNEMKIDMGVDDSSGAVIILFLLLLGIALLLTLTKKYLADHVGEKLYESAEDRQKVLPAIF